MGVGVRRGQAGARGCLRSCARDCFGRALAAALLCADRGRADGEPLPAAYAHQAEAARMEVRGRGGPWLVTDQRETPRRVVWLVTDPRETPAVALLGGGVNSTSLCA